MSEKKAKHGKAPASEPNSWDGFFALRDAGVEEARDFLLDRSDPPAQSRTLVGPNQTFRRR